VGLAESAAMPLRELAHEACVRSESYLLAFDKPGSRECTATESTMTQCFGGELLVLEHTPHRHISLVAALRVAVVGLGSR